jgi:membrane protease YdiL (CAAX protease family)
MPLPESLDPEVDHLPGLEPALVPPEALESSSFRAVPWRWRDVIIGLAPLVLMQTTSAFSGPAGFLASHRWMWIPISLLAQAWMLGLPLRVARRRVGLPRIPGPRAIAVEAAFALLALPVVLAAMFGLAWALVGLFGQAGMPGRPMEPIAASPDRYNPLFLVILAVGVAPLVEEVFFRGMFYNALRRRMHPALAATLQAAAFAFLHPFGAADRVSVAVGGLLFAIFYDWRKTLLAPILLHVLGNVIGLGIMFREVAAYADAPVLGVRMASRDEGGLITEVIPGGTAEASGLRAGDVLTTVNGVPVSGQGAVVQILRGLRVGDEIPLDYIRDGEAYQVGATLKARRK